MVSIFVGIKLRGIIALETQNNEEYDSKMYLRQGSFSICFLFLSGTWDECFLYDLAYKNRKCFIPCQLIMFYQPAIGIGEAILGPSNTKLYSGLEMKLMKLRLWLRQLSYFSKIQSSGFRQSLYELLSQTAKYFNSIHLSRLG